MLDLSLSVQSGTLVTSILVTLAETDLTIPIGVVHRELIDQVFHDSFQFTLCCVQLSCLTRLQHVALCCGVSPGLVEQVLIVIHGGSGAILNWTLSHVLFLPLCGTTHQESVVVRDVTLSVINFVCGNRCIGCCVDILLESMTGCIVPFKDPTFWRVTPRWAKIDNIVRRLIVKVCCAFLVSILHGNRHGLLIGVSLVPWHGILWSLFATINHSKHLGAACIAHLVCTVMMGLLRIVFVEALVRLDIHYHLLILCTQIDCGATNAFGSHSTLADTWIPSLGNASSWVHRMCCDWIIPCMMSSGRFEHLNLFLKFIYLLNFSCHFLILFLYLFLVLFLSFTSLLNVLT